jgi:hypothetical protein
MFTAASASAETLTADQAAERVGYYFAVGALSSAVAVECSDLAAGPAGTNNGRSLTWHGSADIDELMARAIDYESAENILKDKLMVLDKENFKTLEQAEKDHGGRAGMVAMYRQEITSDVHHLGKRWMCASDKYAADSTAVPIVTDATVVTH